MPLTKMPWDYIAILVALAIVVPWRSSVRIQTLLDSEMLVPGERVALYVSTMIFQWGISAIIFWRASAHGLTSAQLGLDVPNLKRALLIAIVLSAALITNQVFGVKRLAGMPPENRGLIARLAEKLLPRTRSEVVVGVALVGTVGICEEFIYRGFIEAVFQSALASVMAGALISAVFFAVAHVYQGRRGLLTTFIVGLIFSGARLWTHSLMPSMIIHFFVDFSAAIAASKMLLGAPPSSEPVSANGDHS